MKDKEIEFIDVDNSPLRLVDVDEKNIILKVSIEKNKVHIVNRTGDSINETITMRIGEFIALINNFQQNI